MMVSMVMIVQTYASSMPILYFAAFLFFLNIYWTDKILFLRYYKNLPPYTKGMVISVIKIMEWGVVVHLLFGALMFTNESVFDYKVDEEDEIFKPYVYSVGNFTSQYMHYDGTRFNKPHGAVYIFLSEILIALFLFDKISSMFLDSEGGLFSYLIVLPCHMCQKKD